MRPAEVGAMGWDELQDLQAAWADAPPAHLALRRIEAVVRAIGGAPPIESSTNDVPMGISSTSTPDEIMAFISSKGARA